MAVNFKKVAAVTALCCLASVATIGITGAYATDKEKKTNNVTYGHIETQLTEPLWDAWDEKTEAERTQERTMWPGKIVEKDPTVTNLATSTNPCYAYLIVETPKANVRLYDDTTKLYANNGNPQNVELIRYTPDANWTELTKYRVDSATSKTVKRVFAYNEELQPGESTTPLFKEIQYINVVEGEISEKTNLLVDVNAVTLQSKWVSDGQNFVTTPAAAYDVFIAGGGK